MVLIALIWNVAFSISIFKTVYPQQSESPGSGCGQDPCVNLWVQYGQYCYTVGKPPLTWEKAASSCFSFGGILTSVHSKEEHDFLNHFLEQQKINMWIGMHDRETEGNHLWLDRSVVNFTKWGPGQPSGTQIVNTLPENCIEMRYQPSRGVTGDWNDENCNSERAYICRKSVQTSCNMAASTMEDDEPIQTTSTSTMENDENIETTTTSTMKDDVPIQVAKSTATGTMRDDERIITAIMTFIVALLSYCVPFLMG